MRFLPAVFSALLLVACGGGSDTSAPTASTPTTPTTPTPVLIQDSFGRTVFDSTQASAGGGDGVGSGDSGADGSAGDGAPIVGGTVVVTDANGKTATAKTDAIGYYRVKITGFAPPFVAKVTKPDGTVRYSLSVTPVVVNKFLTLNLSSLTDKIASDVAVAGGKTGAQELTPTIVAANSAAIVKAKSDLATQFSKVIKDAGLDPAKFDPLTVPFVANRTGYDNVLDNTVITKTATGATVVAVAPVYVPPAAVVPVSEPSKLIFLTGTWELTDTPTGSTSSTPELVSGSIVPPTQAAMTDFYWVSAFLQTLAEEENRKNPGSNVKISYIKIEGGGVSFEFTSSYYSLAKISLAISNYVGCDACGIGSIVSFNYTLVSTFGSTPSETSTGLWKFVRKS